MPQTKTTEARCFVQVLIRDLAGQREASRLYSGLTLPEAWRCARRLRALYSGGAEVVIGRRRTNI